MTAHDLLEPAAIRLKFATPFLGNECLDVAQPECGQFAALGDRSPVGQDCDAGTSPANVIQSRGDRLAERDRRPMQAVGPQEGPLRGWMQTQICCQRPEYIRVAVVM